MKKIGKLFNVSGTTIKKRALKFGIELPIRCLFPKDFTPYNKLYRKCIRCGELVNTGKKYCSKFCATQNRIITDLDKVSTDKSRKKILMRERNHQCEICKLTEWMGKSIPLILDHIDGNSDNNVTENLRLVCGNCDMQLPTYKSKNKGSGRFKRRQRYAENKSF